MTHSFPIVAHPKASAAAGCLGFVVASTRQGTFIVNRFDRMVCQTDEGHRNLTQGVGAYLLGLGAYEEEEAQAVCRLLDLRRKHHGDGVIALDCGANIGVFTVVWARYMTGWGGVLAIEPQQRLYYALCGNIVLNNCWNAQAIQFAIARENGWIPFTEPDYTRYGQFGALNLREDSGTGQAPNVSRKTSVQAMTVDSMNLSRLDMLKLDLEGMEREALLGAADTIRQFKPVISVEIIHDTTHQIMPLLEEFGYLPMREWPKGTLQAVLVHPDDPISHHR